MWYAHLPRHERRSPHGGRRPPGGHEPAGGWPTSTHCVLTAHSGMRNLSMFDDIHSLEPGDLVLLHTMNKTLAYKMVDSEVVLPEEMESLTIEPGADKVTLVTCTPVGVVTSPVGALRAHQVQQERTSTSKSRWPAATGASASSPCLSWSWPLCCCCWTS